MGSNKFSDRSTNIEGKLGSGIRKASHYKPPFTLSQIKKAIPPHCFQHSFLRSFSYIFYDLTLSFIFYYIASTYISCLPNPLPYLAWPIYWGLQGCVFTGVWVLGRDCGHHALSDYRWIDDFVGFILHSALLIPYFSWKYSHHKHHSYIGSLALDETLFAKTKSNVPWYSKYLSNNPVGRLFSLIVMISVDWPLYLMSNVSSRPYDRFACHCDPNNLIFLDQERLQIFLDDIGVLTTIYILYRITITKGLTWMIFIYVVPLLINCCFIIIVTYSQHTQPSIPRYGPSEWDWLIDAISTVDRDYGILNKVFHNMADTQVTRRLFSTIPHYHAMEATKAIKSLLGDYYQFDGTPIYIAVWREAKECVYVEDDNDDCGIFWYRNQF